MLGWPGKITLRFKSFKCTRAPRRRLTVHGQECEATNTAERVPHSETLHSPEGQLLTQRAQYQDQIAC